VTGYIRGIGGDDTLAGAGGDDRLFGGSGKTASMVSRTETPAASEKRLRIPAFGSFPDDGCRE
jgi:hypothetical protein